MSCLALLLVEQRRTETDIPHEIILEVIPPSHVCYSPRLTRLIKLGSTVSVFDDDETDLS